MNRNPKEILELCRKLEKDQALLRNYVDQRTYWQRRQCINDRIYSLNLSGRVDPDIQVRDQIRRWFDWKFGVAQSETNSYAQFPDFWGAAELVDEDVEPKLVPKAAEPKAPKPKTPMAMPEHELAYHLHCIAITLENEQQFYGLMNNAVLLLPQNRGSAVETWAKSKERDRWQAVTAAQGDYGKAVASLVNYFEDTYDLSDRTNFDYPIVEFWRDEVRTPSRVASAQITTPTQKETTMNIITITTKTFANGNDISKMPDSEVYSMIADQEKHIETLEAIKAKPKKLVKEIEERRAGIAALVAYLDSKE